MPEILDEAPRQVRTAQSIARVEIYCEPQRAQADNRLKFHFDKHDIDAQGNCVSPARGYFDGDVVDERFGDIAGVTIDVPGKSSMTVAQLAPYIKAAGYALLKRKREAEAMAMAAASAAQVAADAAAESEMELSND